MNEIDRRAFIKALGAGTAAAMLPASIQRALAIPAYNATGTLMDVEHVVILMQENRSFDHYLGTLQGVRGFNDPRAVKLSTGNSVWHQPTGTGTDYVLPFHPTTPVSGTTTAPDMGTTFIEDLDHGWQGTHLAWNNGQWDQWVPNKTATTMAYLTREDIPFHYALADAFTVCDGYHCSLMGPTDPNRYHMWTGWVGNDGNGGGPVVDNAEQGYWWSTYPEKLQAAGVSCKVYQDVGTGLTADGYWGWTSNPYIGNYGPVPERGARYRAGRYRPDRHRHLGRRDLVRFICRRRSRRQTSPSLLDRGAGGLLRTPQLDSELGRLLRF